MGGAALNCKKPFADFGCGQCFPCRINTRRKWATRIMFEAGYHEKTAFLTLTQDDEHVRKDASGRFILRRKDFRDFVNRLRGYLPPRSLSLYGVGEYGHEGARKWNPHYHAALFGYACDGQANITNELR